MSDVEYLIAYLDEEEKEELKSTFLNVFGTKQYDISSDEFKLIIKDILPTRIKQTIGWLEFVDFNTAKKCKNKFKDETIVEIDLYYFCQDYKGKKYLLVGTTHLISNLTFN